MTWTKLLASRDVQRHRTSKKELDDIRALIARDLADAEGVEIRTYEIIYKLLEDIEKAMVGMLAPAFEEVVTGEAEVREIFSVPRVGKVAGCYVTNGVITRGSKVRFLREGTIIWKGEVSSLKRFKEDAREHQHVR